MHTTDGDPWPAWDLENDPTCVWCGELSETDICAACRYEQERQ